MSVPKQTVLVVDDAPENILLLDEILNDTYKVRAARSGQIALGIAQSAVRPDLILLDVMMPEMDGFETCRRLKYHELSRHIPVIFVTALGEVADEAQGFELGAVDYIHKPVSPPLVKARVRTHLALYDQQRELERMVRERTEELNQTRLQIIRNLGRAGEFRDNETGRHVIRVGHYCRLLAQAIGMNEEDSDLIFQASLMHDIGKIGIPDSILLKPSRLTEDEMAVMQRHAVIGAEILGEYRSRLLDMARIIALTHHEKWDGTGYPHGLQYEDIPLVGRIAALADVFDALTSVRPYKHSWEVEEAVEHINHESGKHFDPYLVETFNAILPQILGFREEYCDRCPPTNMNRL
jgi:putative two-component system response regulator